MTSGSWLNTDKLYLTFGTSKPANDLSGEFNTRGDRREIELTVDLSTITSSSTGNPTIVSDNLQFPTGVLIEEVQVLGQSMPASANATINFGLINASDRATVISSQAFVNAITHSTMCPNGALTVLRVGSNSAGSLIGSVASSVGNVSAYFGTASVTGTVRLRIMYVATQTISS